MNYILFTSAKHESIKFDFTPKQLELFRKLWKDGAGHSKICEELKINKNNISFTDNRPERCRCY